MRDSRWIQPAAIVVLAACVAWLGLDRAEADRQQLGISQEMTHVKAVAEQALPTNVQERIVQLPEDGDQYNTVLVLHDDWQRRPVERELVAWFDVQPELASLKAQTQFYPLTSESATYQEFVTAAGGEAELPAMFVSTEKGRVVYKASASGLPGSSYEMAVEVQKLFKHRPWLPWRKHHVCPGPGPCPEPTPKPEPGPKPNVNVEVKIPDLRPKEPEAVESNDLWLVLGAAAGVAAVVAVLVNFRKASGG